MSIPMTLWLMSPGVSDHKDSEKSHVHELALQVRHHSSYILLGTQDIDIKCRGLHKDINTRRQDSIGVISETSNHSTYEESKGNK